MNTDILFLIGFVLQSSRAAPQPDTHVHVYIPPSPPPPSGGKVISPRVIYPENVKYIGGDTVPLPSLSQGLDSLTYARANVE